MHLITNTGKMPLVIYPSRTGDCWENTSIVVAPHVPPLHHCTTSTCSWAMCRKQRYVAQIMVNFSKNDGQIGTGGNDNQVVDVCVGKEQDWSFMSDLTLIILSQNEGNFAKMVQPICAYNKLWTVQCKEKTYSNLIDSLWFAVITPSRALNIIAIKSQKTVVIHLPSSWTSHPLFH